MAFKKLKQRGIVTVILSTHPHPKQEAYGIINHKVRYFELDGLFDEVHATREYHASKGEYMTRILKKKRNIKESSPDDGG